MRPQIICPIKETLRLLGKRWTILIIKEIYFSKSKKMGFMELKRALEGISTKMLSERLKEMAASKLLFRREDPSFAPPRVNYTLTDKGKDACQIISSLKEYGLKWGDGEFDCGDTDCELCIKKNDEG